MKLAEIETGKVKARYLVAAGNIANYELHSTDEAVELYNQGSTRTRTTSRPSSGSTRS
jgi:hypothetical protein